jgi:alpha-L-rhamnosidase
MKRDGESALVQSSPYRMGEPVDKGIRSPYIIVDFGRPVFGFPKVRLEGKAQGIVEMTYGIDLFNGRTVSLLGGVPYGDRYVMRAGKQTWQVFEYKTFRYLEIVFRNVDDALTLDRISVVAYEYPAERKGRFECSNPKLTKLWKACIDTTYLHMEDTLVCDAVRERLPWTGDGAHGLHGIYAGYGDVAITDWYLRLITRGALGDGSLRIMYPCPEAAVGGSPGYQGAAAAANPLNIPQHALVYALGVAENYEYFGKRKLLEDLYPTLVGLAQWYERHSDGTTGLVYTLSNLSWLDWVPTDMNGANFETNALYCKSLDEMSALARALGKSQEAAQWKSQADLVRASLRRLHWNPERELYVDNVVDGRQSQTLTELANGMAVLFDIATPDQTPKIIRHLANPSSDVFLSTPLFFYYVLEALIKAGATETALKFMDERYVPMLEASDVPTMREFWSPYVRAWTPGGQITKLKLGYSGQLASPAHSGSVSPAWTLSKHILGVYPVGAGFQKCRIAPQTGQLQWARGVFPSARGDIKVEWKKEGDRLVMDTVLPPGLETDLTLARKAGVDYQLMHNGKMYEVRARTDSVAGLLLTEDQIVVRVVGGSHHLELATKQE